MFSAIVPKNKPVMLFVGAAYMLYLAWKTFKSAGHLENSESRRGFLSGLVLQFVNPKIYIYLYGIVSMEVYVLPFFGGQPAILAGFALLLAFIGFTFSLCWSGFGSVFRLIFSQYAKLTNTIMALLLLYCAISLFL